jgi:hypothetical protein
MGGMKVHERIDGRLRDFIEAQPMFFVATAPTGPAGHVNVSPKGMNGTLAVLGSRRRPTFTGSGRSSTSRSSGSATPAATRFPS